MHLRRILLRPAMVICTIGIIALGAIWIRSAFCSDALFYPWQRNPQSSTYFVILNQNRGLLQIGYWKYGPGEFSPDDIKTRRAFSFRRNLPLSQPGMSWWDFRWRNQVSGPMWDCRLTFPIWVPILLLSALWTILFIRTKRRLRMRTGGFPMEDVAVAKF